MLVDIKINILKGETSAKNAKKHHNSNPVMNQHLEKLREIHEQLKKSLRNIITTQAKYYNTKHKLISFVIRDKVLLTTKNIQIIRSSKKLEN